MLFNCDNFILDKEFKGYLERSEGKIDGGFAETKKSHEKGFKEAAIDHRALKNQIESLAVLTAIEFVKVNGRLDDITENTARSFGKVESRLQSIEN